ncbi:MAG: hypothetical protein IM337_07360 [Microcystis sp. M110S1]|uniref:hypothetical protein n=1 Tax=Microcystis sp. M110S1 TaxID=2771102 RepID=UPI002585AE3A|nr:hypothetical protein [Microcystis sp. M110S1]MCA2973820.1 hypothetical protein [Microcystis sp. M110S1]
MVSENSTLLTTTKSLKEILQERGSSHGPFDNQAKAAQELKAVFYKYYNVGNWHTDGVVREAVDMILHKISRIAVGNPYFEDHWKDIGGYAALPPKFIKMQKVKVIPDND